MFSPIKSTLIKILKKYGYNVEPGIFSVPPKIEMGDLALPCFDLAKKYKKNPVELAKDLSIKIQDSKIQRVEAVGPYLNFYFSPKFYNKTVLRNKIKFAKSKKRVMIEYSQPNTHKEFHIGHLRNAVLGSSLVNLKRFCGQNVLAANYLGDTGVHVAKWLWWFFKKYQGRLPEMKTDFLGKIYTEATFELEQNPDLTAEVSLMHQTLEKVLRKNFVREKMDENEKLIFEIWQKTKQASMKYFFGIYEILNIKFDLCFFESEEEFTGKKLLTDILNNNTLPQIKKSEGAIIADLREFNLDVLVLIKSDGNALYGAKDLPLGIKKFKKYKVDESVYIVDKRQSLYLQQIFKILSLLGYEKQIKKHIGYDFVTLPEGAMSSRKGNVVVFDDFYEEVLKKCLLETEKRHPDWPKIKIKKTAQVLALAGIKFFLLKYDNSSVIVFDVEKALAFEGDSGLYLLYVLARISSILKKSKISFLSGNADLLIETTEKKLLQKIAEFEEVLIKANEEDTLNGLCVYLLELGQIFNCFYHDCPILTVEKNLRQARLLLCQKTAEIMNIGLKILNIESLQEM